ncbi:MAG: hypothetical protein ABL903_14720 [Methylococcales bacterium]
MKTVLSKNLLLIICLSVLLVACADWTKGSKSSVENLTDRASSRWQALLKKDWEAAYQFELPAYRQTHNIDQYKAKFGTTLLWKMFKVDTVTIHAETNTADVALTLTYDFTMPGTGVTEGSSQINERWMQQDNEWWMVD